MGLEKLHEVANKPTSLKIEMWDDRAPDSKNPNEYYWAIYTFSVRDTFLFFIHSLFQIEDENTNYTAHFGYDWQNPQGNATTGW